MTLPKYTMHARRQLTGEERCAMFIGICGLIVGVYGFATSHLIPLLAGMFLWWRADCVYAEVEKQIGPRFIFEEDNTP